MKILKEFVLRSIAGEYVLIPVGATASQINGMISMSATAAFMWEHLEKCENSEQMLQLVLDEFEVEPERARRDVEGFVANLKQAGFIE